jgi:hypothetical protein
MSPVARTRRGKRSFSLVRAAALLAAAGLGVASIVALATDHLKTSQGGGIKVVSGGFNPNGAGRPATSQPASAPTATAGPASGGGLAAALSPLESTAPGVAGASQAPAEPGTATTPSEEATGSAGGGAPAPAPASTRRVAVVSGFLSMSAFGSQVALPLLCGVVVGGFGPLFTNPVLTKVALAITSSCVTYGNQGAVAFTALNERLAALSAADPAVNPAIAELASLFNSIGSSGAPFATSMIQIAQLINFFQGS